MYLGKVARAEKLIDAVNHIFSGGFTERQCLQPPLRGTEALVRFIRLPCGIGSLPGRSQSKLDLRQHVGVKVLVLCNIRYLITLSHF